MVRRSRTSIHMVRRTSAVTLAAFATVAIGVSAASANSRASVKKHQYTIGVSNTVVGNGWREEMICSVQAEARASGSASKVIVSSINGSAPDQVAAIRTLISSGVNAIIADPADSKALNSVIAQAKARGIVFVAVDQPVTSSDAYDVTNNQEEYGYLGALWLAKKLKGHGNVLELRGAAGAPADAERQAGFEKAMKKYPGIKVVKQVYTGWEYGTAGQDALQVLNSGAKIDGIWTSGTDYTVVNAVKSTGKKLIPVVGADDNAFLGQLLKGYPGVAITNPAVVGAAGLRVALEALEGKKPPRKTLLTPAVWDAQNKSVWKSFYKRSLPATYSSTLKLKHWTTYTVPELEGCKGPTS